jgi:putative ABC transport system permease protein
MNLLTLSIAGLRGGFLTHALNSIVLGLGLGTITLLLLFSAAVGDRIVRDARGIDLVVGAKGSPLQLVLSTVFQADVPTGNIPLAEALTLLKNPMIERGVPMALGDAVKSFRIVGTTPDYLDVYGARLAEGRIWGQPMEAVLGAETARRLKLSVGDSFVGAHGVAGNGEAHAATPYTVTGILAPTGSVIDRLALTPIESVWKVHEGHRHHEAGTPEAGPEVTAILLHVRTPLAVVTLPHQIDAQTGMQAAIPSFEAARLLSLLGFGLDAFRALAGILIASAGLGMLIALVTRMRERRRELAVLRLLGATPAQLFATILIEAMLLAGAGAALGLLFGHAIVWGLAEFLPAGHALAGMSLGWRPSEWLIPAVALGIGLVASLVPAVTAYRTDVSAALAAGPD